jgi:N-acetyl-anhydromuramyl-L-alanine amidase AmpD
MNMDLIDMQTSPPRHMWKTWDRRTLPLTHVVVHHSATSPDTSIYEIAFYHVNNKDMPAIQYHYVITPSGKVCWMNEHEDLVWHGNSSNDYALGVCLIGDFTKEPPSRVQLAALQSLLAHIEQVEGRTLQVIGHQDVWDANTECPGRTWPAWKEQAVAMNRQGEILDDPVEQAKKNLWWIEEARRYQEDAAKIRADAEEAYAAAMDDANYMEGKAERIMREMVDHDGPAYHLVNLLENQTCSD